MAGTSTRHGPRKRRPVAGDPLRKAGWQVRQSVAEAVKDAVEKGAAKSQNAFVERALLRELRELRRQRVYAAYAQAAEDPMFNEDMRSTTAAFESTASDGLAEGQG